MIHVQWIGAAGLIFSDGSGSFLVDPYFSRPGMGKVLFGRIEPNQRIIEACLQSVPKPIRGLVVSHTHFDHALDIPALSGHVSGPILGSRSLATLMKAYGLEVRVRVCNVGEEVWVGPGLSVTMLPSIHGKVAMGRVPYPGDIETGLSLPLKTGQYRSGQVFAPKVRIGDCVFLHLGSAGFLDEALVGHTCRVLFLCVPGWTRMPGYPEHVIETTCPETVVLFHHDNFFKPVQEKKTVPSFGLIRMKALKERILKKFPRVRLMCPAMFETMEF